MERTKCCELRWKRFPRACAHMWGLPHVTFREASSRREDKRRRGRSRREEAGVEGRKQQQQEKLEEVKSKIRRKETIKSKKSVRQKMNK